MKQFFSYNLKHNQQSGFTLVETFVAIVVLMVVVLGPMSLLSTALKDSRYIKDEITATFLAQEGVELIIDQRNNGHPLFVGVYSYCHLKIDNNLGYQCSLGEDTIFTREITSISKNKDKGEYEIVSKVTRNNFPGRIIESKSIIFVNQND